jgi:hypothetical protein
MNPEHKAIVVLSAAAAAPATTNALESIIHGEQAYRILPIWVFFFCLALVHGLFLGLPAFLFLKRANLTQWWVSLIGGFVIGITPAGTLIFVVVPAIEHFRWAQPDPALPILTCGVWGMIGGFAGWLVWKYLPSPATSSRGADTK